MGQNATVNLYCINTKDKLYYTNMWFIMGQMEL